MTDRRIYVVHWAVVGWVLLGLSHSSIVAADNPADYFGIQMIDDETGAPVPLVRLTTTGAIEHWTDSQGWIAFLEPGLMDREVHFAIDSPGYEYPKDGFGYSGVRLRTTPGKTEIVKLKRTQLAERLVRVTGQGIYRDSELLGQKSPRHTPALNVAVIGLDSVQAVPYRGRVFWLWGDTSLPNYPLGNFHVSAATSPMPHTGDFNSSANVPLEYFLSDDGTRVRGMLPDDQPGAVWLFGLINLSEQSSAEEILLAHYSRHLRLGEMVEHGVARFNDEKGLFEKVATFDKNNTWQLPRGNSVRVQDKGEDHIYFAEPFATTRVPAKFDSVLDPNEYEAFTFDEKTKQWGWFKDRQPVTQTKELEWIKAGALPKEMARFQVVDADSGKPVQMHRASVNWNEYRKRWIMIACEVNWTGGPSHLGEIWYCEAESITGPWLKAIKIATHPKYSFYNPRQHPFLDEDHGRIIYFEGTYTHMFSGNEQRTPRYDYNQLMYRLDLNGSCEPKSAAPKMFPR